MDYDNSQDIGEYNPKKTSSTRGFEDCHTAQWSNTADTLRNTRHVQRDPNMRWPAIHQHFWLMGRLDSWYKYVPSGNLT